jgi:DNA-directed RNA polymerase subunit RPC12/RpoP
MEVTVEKKSIEMEVPVETDVRVFKCASCAHTFSQDPSQHALRCPECWGKTLILVEGPSLRGAKNCGGNCGSCSCGCH